MTKQELIEALKDYPDDFPILVNCWHLKEGNGDARIIGTHLIIEKNKAYILID